MGTLKFSERFNPRLKILRKTSWEEEGLELTLIVWVGVEEWEA